MGDQTSEVVTIDDERWQELQLLLREAMESANKAEFEEALNICRKAIAAFPANAEPYFILAVLTANFGDEGQAIKMAETAHNMEPEVAEYAKVLATLSTRIGRLADGIYYAKLTHACEPHPYLGSFVPSNFVDFELALQSAGPSKHGIQGQRLFNEAHYQSAFREFNSEIRLNPENVITLVWLARTAVMLGHFNQAVGALQAALRLEPKNGLAMGLLVRALVSQGRTSEAVAAAKETIRISNGDAEAYLQAMHGLSLSADVSNSTLKDLAATFQKMFNEEYEPEPLEQMDKDQTEVPRIGFISNGFFRAPGAEITSPWFAVPKSKSVTICGYKQSVASDSMTTLFNSGCDVWRDIYGIDPFTLSITMRAEELDVVVDISQIDGETRGAVVGLNPAPIRVGFSALPEPGLAPGVTHVLTDEVLADGDSEMLLEGQSLIKVLGTLYPHMPMAGVPQDTPAPATLSDRVTLAAMAVLPNATPAWAMMVGRILRGIPNAELLLFGAEELSDHGRSMIREYFMNAGVVDRVSFAHDPADDSKSQTQTLIAPSHWADIDLFLDTSPINGRKELCEALWSGVPVVTRKGNRRASSIGASILTAATRPGWVAKSDDEYVDIALALTESPDRLQKERSALQSMIATTPLFDPMKSALAVRAALVDIAKKSRNP